MDDNPYKSPRTGGQSGSRTSLPRQLLIVALTLSVLAFLYSLTGVAMAYWVVAVPGNKPGHIRLNFLVWVPASILTLGLTAFFASRLARRSSR